MFGNRHISGMFLNEAMVGSLGPPQAWTIADVRLTGLFMPEPQGHWEPQNGVGALVCRAPVKGFQVPF